MTGRKSKKPPTALSLDRKNIKLNKEKLNITHTEETTAKRVIRTTGRGEERA